MKSESFGRGWRNRKQRREREGVRKNGEEEVIEGDWKGKREGRQKIKGVYSTKGSKISGSFILLKKNPPEDHLYTYISLFSNSLQLGTNPPCNYVPKALLSLSWNKYLGNKILP